MADARTRRVDAAFVLHKGQQSGVFARQAAAHEESVVDEQAYFGRFVVFESLVVETSDDERVAIAIGLLIIIRCVIIDQALAKAIGNVAWHDETHLEPAIRNISFSIENHAIAQLETIRMAVGVVRTQSGKFGCLVVNNHAHYAVEARRDIAAQVFHHAFNLHRLQCADGVVINGESLPSVVVNLNGIQVVARIFPVDAHRFHRPLRIGQTQGRVAEKHIAFLVFLARGFRHAVHVAQAVMLLAHNAEKVVVDALAEGEVVRALCHPRSGEHGNHAAVLVEEGVFAQRGTHVVVVAAELAGTRNHQRIHRSISP